MHGTLLALSILLMAGGSFGADDFPELKPGLWTNTETISGTRTTTIAGQMCTNNDVFKTNQNMSKDTSRPCKAA